MEGREPSGGENEDGGPSLFCVTETEEKEGHVFIRVSPSDPATIARSLAPRIQNAYFDKESAEKRLRSAAAELKLFDGAAFEISDDVIAEALEEELDAVLPAEWSADNGRPKQLDVQRSELAEIVAAEVLSELFQTVIPALRVSHKEIPDQQTRGADVVGFESRMGDVLPEIVLAEVKGSSDSNSPPGVVKGMQSKLRELSTDRRALLQELIWLRDNCDDSHAAMCAKVCAYFQLKRTLKLRLAPILLRTAGTARSSDPGVFKSEAESFGYNIRFVSVIIDTPDLFNFAVEVYRIARELAPR